MQRHTSQIAKIETEKKEKCINISVILTFSYLKTFSMHLTIKKKHLYITVTHR